MQESEANQIKYTFLVPSYKSSFFSESLESIRQQTYRDFKVLVSDDNSPENLKSIFDKCVGNDNRFLYRKNDENMGSKSLVSHWNLLVEQCSTEYLIMASDDDIYDSRFLEKIDILVTEYPQVDIFRARAQRMENGVIMQKDFNIDEYQSFTHFLADFGHNMVLCLTNYVFRTKRLKEIGNFPDFPTAAFSDTAIAKLLSQNGIATTRDVLFTFRISNVNLSSAESYNKNVENGVVASLMYDDWYKSNISPLLSGDCELDRHLISTICTNNIAFVEGVLYYLMPRLSLIKFFHYLKEFRNRDYFHRKSNIFRIIKNWIMIHK